MKIPSPPPATAGSPPTATAAPAAIPAPPATARSLKTRKGSVVARLSEFLGIQTNNYAEYSGLLAVLNGPSRTVRSSLRVVSDSELMVKQMKGQYKVKSPGLMPLWEEAKTPRRPPRAASRCATPSAAATKKPTAWPTRPWTEAWANRVPAQFEGYGYYRLRKSLLGPRPGHTADQGFIAWHGFTDQCGVFSP